VPGRGWLLFLVLMTITMGLHYWATREEAQAPVSYTTFHAWVNADKVSAVTIRGQEVTGKLKVKAEIQGRLSEQFSTLLPQQQDNELLPLLRSKNVDITVRSEEPPLPLQILLNFAPYLLLIGVWVWLSRRAQSMMAGGPFGILKGKPRRFEKEAQVNVTFDDVAGLKSAKQDLREVVEFLKEPERFRRLGGKVPRGVLLVGPPGTGKTLLARAVAGESGVPFFSISGSEFIELFVGVGASRVRELFEEAKKVAPAIVFIDEIDAVGRSRGVGIGGGHDEREQTLNQLLAEMDGFARNELVVVLAATNRPDVLDPALLRPGRFDRRVLVDRPELGARRAILGVHTKDKPVADDVDLDDIAQRTPGFSGADLANLVNEAALNATRRGAGAIERTDFLAAYDKVVLGDPRETKLEPAEKRRVAVHEAGHAVVAHFARGADVLQRVTIIPRGMALGATQQAPQSDKHLMTQGEIESQLAVLMGGRAAERLILGETSSGAAHDLKQATEIAVKMVAHYGMSERLGPVFHEHRTEHPFLGQTLATEGGTSDATVHLIEEEARKILERAMLAAERLINEHRAGYDRLVAALLERESVEKEEIVTLLGPSSGPAAAVAVPAAAAAAAARAEQ
jgi:cell division protease FtsH